MNFPPIRSSADRILLTTLDELQVADWSTAKQGYPITQQRKCREAWSYPEGVSVVGGVLGSYLHILVPA
jgi:hypothetical protein